MTANPHRGEIAVTLGGREHVLRPTFQAMVEIEQLSGLGLVPLARRVALKQFGAKDVAAVLTAGLNAAREPGSKARTLDEVGQWAAEAGMLTMADVVLLFLNNCLTGGAEPEPGEAGAAEATSSPSAAGQE